MRRLVDLLLLTTMLTITFTKVRWGFGAADVTVAELSAAGFVVAFAVLRIRSGDWRFPRTVQVLAVSSTWSVTPTSRRSTRGTSSRRG